MADTTVPGANNIGIASFAGHTFASTREFISGSKEITTGFENVAAETTLAALSVVARDGSGNLVLADNDDYFPCGILVNDIATGVGVTTTAEVYKSGCFNPDALVWHAGYNTDTLKKRAFEGSVAPEIQILKPRMSHEIDLPA